VNEVEETLAVALAAVTAAEISNAICGFGARLDQLEAARRDLLTPIAALWTPDGVSND
jgi:hypothetical protein